MNQSSSTSALINMPAVPALGDFAAYLRKVNQFPILSESEERSLALAYRNNGDRQAAHSLVCSHLRQVAAIARGYSGYGLDLHDLIQEGNIGLMTAVKKFDPDKGVRLAAYAAYWIRSLINEFVIRNWRIVKVATTRSQRKLFYNLRKMTQQLGRKLSGADVERISDELSVSKEDVLTMHSRMHSADIPFEQKNREDGYDTSPAAFLAADDGSHAETILTENSRLQERRDALKDALTLLNERERQIVQARLLSESGKDIKLADLGKQLGISAERVRQLEKKAFAKLQAGVLQRCPA
ncbi:MAG: RNA polymerase sigma factor RpoH [Betaproteobacteria bacterium]|nr:RNA polymerase sigma factor RpoH [Betaproteobacteria bacterium]